jgi:hypothetical protein
MLISENQLPANRQNVPKATGPKSESAEPEREPSIDLPKTNPIVCCEVST